jgi:hypothetical protein
MKSRSGPLFTGSLLEPALYSLSCGPKVTIEHTRQGDGTIVLLPVGSVAISEFLSWSPDLRTEVVGDGSL